MFRNMRRKNQALSQEKCEEIINSCTSGVLNLIGDDGYPYGVPISYAYDNKKFYFHSAKQGHKIDAMRNNDKASFTIIYKDDVKGEEFTTQFTSVVAFGKVKILEDPEEIMSAIVKIGSRYAPAGIEDKMNEHIRQYWNNFYIIEFSAEHITGKAAKSLL